MIFAKISNYFLEKYLIIGKIFKLFSVIIIVTYNLALTLRDAISPTSRWIQQHLISSFSNKLGKFYHSRFH
jgi:hypothetical protein